MAVQILGKFWDFLFFSRRMLSEASTLSLEEFPKKYCVVISSQIIISLGSNHSSVHVG